MLGCPLPTKTRAICMLKCFTGRGPEGTANCRIQPRRAILRNYIEEREKGKLSLIYIIKATKILFWKQESGSFNGKLVSKMLQGEGLKIKFIHLPFGNCLL